MPQHSYDPEYEPPAPTISIELTAKVGPNQAKVEIRLMLDTGADISCVPRAAIERLERQLGRKLPYSLAEVQGFYDDGTVKNGEIYLLHTPNDKLGKGQGFMFLAVPSKIGYVGRDILNTHQLKLDPANDFWEYE